MKTLSKKYKKHIEKLKIYKEKSIVNNTSSYKILMILINDLSSGHLQEVNAVDKSYQYIAR